MDTTTLKKANDLQAQIDIVKREIEKYDPKNNIVCLQTQDHYGNKGVYLKMYAFKDLDHDALDKPGDLIRDEYRKFLKASQEILKKRLKELEKELANL